MNDAHLQKRTIPLAHCHRLLAPRLTYLITTRWATDNTALDIMPLTNLTSVSTDPQRIVIAVYKQWQTLHNIRHYKEFVVNIPSRILLDAVWITGHRYSGVQLPDQKAKPQAAGVTIVKSNIIDTGSLLECYGHLECRVQSEYDVGDHIMFLADIVTGSGLSSLVGEQNIINVEAAQSILQNSQNRFCFPSGELFVSTEDVIRKMNENIRKTLT